jgi:hypothetical protein
VRVRDYEIGEKLGEGAFGATYAAKRTGTDDQFVIKRIAVRGLSDWKPVERLEREAEVLQSLDHPGVVEFVDAFEAELQRVLPDEVGEEGPQFCLVSRRVEGEPLAAKIKRRTRWTESQARKLLESLLETLEYLHGLSPRVIHRDIKPGNIIVQPDGSPVLVDFGSVLDLSARGADGGPTFAGTAGYMAPEQAIGSVDARSDLYGLGTTMLHVLTHQHPADLPRSGLRFDIRDRLGVSDQLHGVLMRLVEPEPDQRFHSAADALAALRRDPKAPTAPNPALSLPPGMHAAPLMPYGPPPVTTALAHQEPRAIATSAPRAVSPALRPILVPARTYQAGPTNLPLLLMGSMGMVAGVILAAMSPIMFLLMPMFAVLAGIRLNTQRERGRILRARALYTNGASTLGRLTWGWFNPGSTSLRYRYQVQGIPFDGYMETSDLTRSRSLRYKDPVHVFYDPSDPSVHVALLDYELAEVQSSAA